MPKTKTTLIFTILLAFCVIVFGAYVRLTDAGLGCPDWPGCYGFMTVPDTAEELAAIEESFPGQVVEPGKAWREMIHRYIASLLGLLILILFVSEALKKNKTVFSDNFNLKMSLLLLVGHLSGFVGNVDSNPQGSPFCGFGAPGGWAVNTVSIVYLFKKN